MARAPDFCRLCRSWHDLRDECPPEEFRVTVDPTLRGPQATAMIQTPPTESEGGDAPIDEQNDEQAPPQSPPPESPAASLPQTDESQPETPIPPAQADACATESPPESLNDSRQDISTDEDLPSNETGTEQEPHTSALTNASEEVTEEAEPQPMSLSEWIADVEQRLSQLEERVYPIEGEDPKFDKKVWQRNYMRRKRAEERAARTSKTSIP
jgi:hypothetical protein